MDYKSNTNKLLTPPLAVHNNLTFAMDVDVELLVDYEGGVNDEWFENAAKRGVNAISF